MEEAGSVERAGGLVFVLEVGVDLASPGEGLEASGEGSDLFGRVASVATETEAGESLGRMDFGRGEVVAFSDTKRGVGLREDGVDGIGEPGLVTELEGDGGACLRGERGEFEEGLEAVWIGLEVRGKLEEQEAEFAGFVDWLKRSEELVDRGLAVAQAFEVCDALRGLEAEAEVRGCGGEPAFEHGAGGQRAEGVVDLNRVELRRVEGEELLRAGAGGVKARLPRGVGPAGGPGVDGLGRRAFRGKAHANSLS